MFPTFIMVDSCDKQRLCNMNVMNGPGIPEWSRNTSHVLILVFCYVYLPGPALSQLHQLLSIGPRAGNIYSRLFRYTQQHTAGFTETNWAPHLLQPSLLPTNTIQLLCHLFTFLFKL